MAGFHGGGCRARSGADQRRHPRRHPRGALLAAAASLAIVAGACTTPPPGGGPANVAPVAAYTAVASAGEAPFTAQFSSAGSTDSDGAIVEYRWNFGDGTTANEANPAKVYAQPGTYDVSLEVVDDDGASAAVSTLTVTAYVAGDPASLVLFPQLSRSVSLGVDRIGVWSCVVEGAGGPTPVPEQVAAWAQSASDSYFGTVSRGRYQPVFTALGTFAAEGPADCLAGAESRTGAPFTNVMVVDNGLAGGGLGGPGIVYGNGTGAAPTAPPSESSRGFIVWGDSYSGFPNPRVLLHEIGHTLHWPHSYLTPTNQYDNPTDLMSAWTGPQTCTVPGWVYQCEPQHALAFNRWASGWIDPGEVVVHTGGSRTVDLAGPESAGTQLVVAPSVTSSRALVTVEARPKTGFDHILDVGGVAVHLVDQRRAMCDVPAFDGCPSLWRRQGQAMGAPNTYEHVLQPGQTRTVHGLTITVVASTASGYRVSITGAPVVAADALQPRPALRSGVDRPRPDGGWSVDLPSGGAPR